MSLGMVGQTAESVRFTALRPAVSQNSSALLGRDVGPFGEGVWTTKGRYPASSPGGRAMIGDADRATEGAGGASFISDRPIASAASSRDRRSSSVKRMRPETFPLRIRFSRRRYSFWSVSSRQSSRATGRSPAREPRPPAPQRPFPSSPASRNRGIEEGREHHEKGCTSILEARRVFGQDGESGEQDEFLRWAEQVLQAAQA